MIVSYNWLQDFIKDPLPSPEEIAEKLTLRSFEVESFEKMGIKYPGVIVGLVKKVEKHPNADRLSLCLVDIGEGKLKQIICGATNVSVGQLVPVATVGAVLPGGLKIEKAKIRDIESEGMICSSEELGGEKTSGKEILVIEKGASAGDLYDEVVESGVDWVFDIDVLPNRSSDCLSHRGVAREISAIFNLNFLDYDGGVEEFKKNQNFKVEIKDSEICPRYIGAYLTGLEVKDSPEWLQSRLKAIGLRPKNNIVDAANYVMFSLGQPMHAFDAEKLGRNKEGDLEISVRKSEAGEKIKALDGESYEVPEEAIVIMDNTLEKPIALGGVIGGEESAVSPETIDLVLEAASFDPILVRKTSQTLKLQTDSSKRFENEVSSVFPPIALKALIDLLKEIAGTEKISVESIVDVYPSKVEPKEIYISADDVNKLLGSAVSEKEMEEIFGRLGFEFKRDDKSFLVIPPPERTDLSIKEDLIEEVGRVYGYENIKDQNLPEAGRSADFNKKFFWTHKIRDILTFIGWGEVMTYSLVSEGELKIENPLAQDKRFLRGSLLPGLKEALEKNIHHADLLALDKVCIFEIGNVYKDGEEKTSLGLAGRSLKNKKEDVLEEVVEKLGDELGLEIASLFEKKEGVLEIDLKEIIEKLPEPKSFDDLEDLSQDVNYKPFSPYPFVLRDIALWVPEEVTSKEVEKIIKENSGELLVNIYLFDQFKKDGKVSYAFRLVFQSFQKTLSDEEVSVITDKVYERLNSQEGWETR